jgi:hypothetical protein
MELITTRHLDKIRGIIGCYDRVLISGILPGIGTSQGMTSYMYQNKINIFDYAIIFAEPLRDKIRVNAERIAKENGIEIEFIQKKGVRKESIIEKILEKRGYAPGIVHIISAMEACSSYYSWHDKPTGRTFLKGRQSKCLHYYFYFMDEELGLCYVRVPTWCPFRLQVYFNGHNWLSNKLTKSGIAHRMMDNAIVEVEDWEKAQQISDELDVSEIHKKLDYFAYLFCPVYKELDQRYHWSIMQCEYATDVVFNKQEDLQKIYDKIIRTAIHTVKPDNIATFLGKKIHSNYEQEIGNNYHVRLEGSRIKHNMGEVSIKMYDKYQQVLRIETTVNNVSFFKHYRKVEHRDGTHENKDAPMKKNIYSLEPLQTILKAANRRYMEFISAIEDDSVGKSKLKKITAKVTQNERSYKGFNLFDEDDEQTLQILVRGEFNIYGFRAKSLKKYLKKSSSQISRLLKRLHVHGLIKKVRNTYKYYLTELGKQVILTGEKLINLVIIPDLCLN